MKIKYFWSIVLVCLLALLLAACGSNNETSPKPNESGNTEPTTTDADDTSVDTSQDVKESGETKEFTINAANFTFDPAEIRVNQGDKVIITMKNNTGSHGVKILDLGVELKGEGTTEFIADKKGTFIFACSVQCGAGHDNMTGKLIVD